MTHVMNYTAAASLNSNNNLMEYMIEVITFDGESESSMSKPTAPRKLRLRPQPKSPMQTTRWFKVLG